MDSSLSSLSSDFLHRSSHPCHHCNIKKPVVYCCPSLTSNPAPASAAADNSSSSSVCRHYWCPSCLSDSFDYPSDGLERSVKWSCTSCLPPESCRAVLPEPKLSSGEDFPRVSAPKPSKSPSPSPSHSRPSPSPSHSQRSSSSIASDVSILDAWVTSDPLIVSSNFGRPIFRWALDSEAPDVKDSKSAANSSSAANSQLHSAKKKRPREDSNISLDFVPLSIVPSADDDEDLPLAGPVHVSRPPSALIPNPPLEAFPGFCILLGAQPLPLPATVPLSGGKRSSSKPPSKIPHSPLTPSIKDFFPPKPSQPQSSAIVPPPFSPTDYILLPALSWQLRVFCLELPLSLYFLYRSSLQEGAIIWLHSLQRIGARIQAPNRRLSTWRFPMPPNITANLTKDMSTSLGSESKKKKSKSDADSSAAQPLSSSAFMSSISSVSSIAESGADVFSCLSGSPCVSDFLPLSLSRFSIRLFYPGSVPFSVLPIDTRSSFHIVEPDGKLWNSFSSALQKKLLDVPLEVDPKFPVFDLDQLQRTGKVDLNLNLGSDIGNGNNHAEKEKEKKGKDKEKSKDAAKGKSKSPKEMDLKNVTDSASDSEGADEASNDPNNKSKQKKRAPATPATNSRSAVPQKSPSPSLRPLQLPVDTPRTSTKSASSLTPAAALQTPRQIVGYGRNGTPIAAITPRMLNIPADELSSDAQAKALRKLKRLQKELEMNDRFEEAKAKENIKSEPVQEEDEEKEKEKEEEEEESVVKVEVKVEKTVKLKTEKEKEKSKAVTAAPIRSSSNASTAAIPVSVNAGALSLIQTPSFRRLSDDEFLGRKKKKQTKSKSDGTNGKGKAKKSGKQNSESDSEASEESGSESDSASGGSASNSASDASHAESIDDSDSQPASDSESESEGRMSDSEYERRHRPHELEEKEMRNEQRKDSVEVWISCDQCKKWRLINESIQKQGVKQGFYYCGNSLEPKKSKCDELDDWIVRCVGRNAAERLSREGILTVEGLTGKKQLVAKLTEMGFYLDEESLTIRPLED